MNNCKYENVYTAILEFEKQAKLLYYQAISLQPPNIIEMNIELAIRTP